MRKSLLFFFLNLIILLITTSCFVHSSLNYYDSDTEGVPNLLSNPGFAAYSLDPDEALLGWTIHSEGSGNGKTSVFIDGKEALQGNTSLRIDASDQTVMLLSDAFKIRRYGGYYTRLNAKSTQAKGPQIQMNFITFRENGAVYSKYSSKIKTAKDWEKGTISAGFLKPGVSFGRLQIIIPPFSEGSVWLDDSGCWEVHHFRID